MLAKTKKMLSKLDEKDILESKEIDISSIRGRIQLIIFPLLLIGYVSFCYYLYVVKAVEKLE